MGVNDKNVISVTGYGRIFVEPNFLNISIFLGCRSNSMKASLEGINDDMMKLFEFIKLHKIDKKFVQVVDLNFSPKYEWKKNIKEFVGYDVEQKINIELDATKQNEEKVRKIIAEITTLRFLNSCDIEYNLKNKSKHLETVRELSFKNAVEKAEQYAKLAELRIIKANTITDRDSVEEYSRDSSNIYAAEEDCCSSEAHLPKGRKIVLENTVYVTFDVEK